MSKRPQNHKSRPRTRVRADGSVAGGPRPSAEAPKGPEKAPKVQQKAPKGQGAPGAQPAAKMAAKATPARAVSQAVSDEPPVPAGNRPDFGAIFASVSFRRSLWLLNAGVIALLFSQGITHEYGFLELGALFTLSIYDLLLAMLGLALGAAMAETRRDFGAIVGTFLGVIVVMLAFFDPIFRGIMASPLGDIMFLIAPTAVILTGASLWLPGRWRQWAVMLAAAVVGFSFSLFVGLDDIGVGMLNFAAGTVLSALWMVLAPGLMLRHFRGPWLVIPARIVGSWLVVIGIIVTVSLYVPMPIKAPSLPDPSQPDGGAIELQVPADGSAPTLNGQPLDLGEGEDMPDGAAPPETPLPPSAMQASPAKP